MFIGAYERSASSYAAVRHAIGEPDPFRLRLRTQLRTVIANVVRASLGRPAAVKTIAAFAKANVDAADLDKFEEVAESELLALHEGNFARYGIRPSEFAAWQTAWSAPATVKLR